MAEAVTPAGAGSGGSRMHADLETALTAVPGIDWSVCDPKRSCIEELLRNQRIRAKVRLSFSLSLCLSFSLSLSVSLSLSLSL